MVCTGFFGSGLAKPGRQNLGFYLLQHTTEKLHRAEVVRTSDYQGDGQYLILSLCRNYLDKELHFQIPIVIRRDVSQEILLRL